LPFNNCGILKYANNLIKILTFFRLYLSLANKRQFLIAQAAHINTAVISDNISAENTFWRKQQIE
jgi:hypothetical protein